VAPRRRLLLRFPWSGDHSGSTETPVFKISVVCQACPCPGNLSLASARHMNLLSTPETLAFLISGVRSETPRPGNSIFPPLGTIFCRFFLFAPRKFSFSFPEHKASVKKPNFSTKSPRKLFLFKFPGCETFRPPRKRSLF